MTKEEINEELNKGFWEQFRYGQSAYHIGVDDNGEPTIKSLSYWDYWVNPNITDEAIEELENNGVKIEYIPMSEIIERYKGYLTDEDIKKLNDIGE